MLTSTYLLHALTIFFPTPIKPQCQHHQRPRILLERPFHIFEPSGMDPIPFRSPNLTHGLRLDTRVRCPDQILGEVPNKCPRNHRYPVIRTILSDTHHAWDSLAEHILGSSNQIWTSLQQVRRFFIFPNGRYSNTNHTLHFDIVANAERRVDNRKLFLSGRGFVGFVSIG
jgi:hypothetical protein